MIHVRTAGPLDTGAMSDMLNAIIAQGGTTALTSPVSKDDLQTFMTAYPGGSAWRLAEDDAGAILGFQFIEPHAQLPPDACDIATFSRLGRSRMGVGSALFEHSKDAARALGYRWINATIRADNSGGLAYYQSRGFEDYARDRNILLGDGTRVDKISKRYDL